MNNAGLFPGRIIGLSRNFFTFPPGKSALSPFIFAALFILIQIAQLDAHDRTKWRFFRDL